MAKIEIYAGHFGSGKSEIVLNKAIFLRQLGEKVHIIDFDIVKPYFRSRELYNYLKQQNINLIRPDGGLENADLPVVSSKILAALTSVEGKILFDVGGDSLGVIPLNIFKPHFEKQGYTMYFILNPYRPFTGDLISVTKMLTEIEEASHLKIGGIISNPNLGQSTSLNDLLDGYERVNQIADNLGLPVSLTTVTKQYYTAVAQKKSGPLLPIDNYLLPPWELEESQIFDIKPQTHFTGRR